jgi:hypothetical protein
MPFKPKIDTVSRFNLNAGATHCGPPPTVTGLSKSVSAFFIPLDDLN